MAIAHVRTTPGVPLRSAPGYELAALSGRTHKYHVLYVKSVLL